MGWTTSFCPKPPSHPLLPSAPSCQSPRAEGDPPDASLSLPQGSAREPSPPPSSHPPSLPAWSPQMQPHATVTCSPEASCPPPNLRQRQTAWQARASSSQLPQALCPPCLLGPRPPTSSPCREGTAPPPPGSLPEPGLLLEAGKQQHPQLLRVVWGAGWPVGISTVQEDASQP